MQVLGDVKYLVSNSGVITVYVKGKSYSVDTDHVNYDGILQALRDQDSETLLELVDIPQTIQNYTGDVVEVKNGNVYYKGEALHNTLTERILACARLDLPFGGMIKFLENLMLNPSRRAVEELYSFLEHRGLAITEDGCFLAYKSVKDNYLDKYSGKYDNTPGAVIECDRNKVDDNPNNTCSYGFHVGAHEYAGPGGFYNSVGDKIIIVKVNPRDAVAVPTDHSAQKLRVCRYEVVRDYDKLLDAAPIYTADASSPLSSQTTDTYCGQSSCCSCSTDDVDGDDFDDDEDGWNNDDDDDDDDDSWMDDDEDDEDY